MNNIVVITGATGGIGSQISNLCINSAGITKVVLIYKNELKYNNIFGEFKNDKIIKMKCDMCEPYQLELYKILSEIDDVIKVTIVLTSFVIDPIKKIVDLSSEEILRNINTNIVFQIEILKELCLISKHKRFELYVINMDSGAAYTPINGWSLYSSAKAFINMFVKSLQKEESINAVTYNPGVVDTNMQAIIRNANENEFDFVHQFLEYKEKSILNTASDVALNIFQRYILDWKAKEFEERFK